MKNCTKCNFSKSLMDFGKQKIRKDGLFPVCKDCLKIINSSYKNSKEGTIKQMYADMKKRVSNSQYIYWYGKELLSQEDFEKWIKTSNYNLVYDKWIDSGCEKNLRPSIDRLNGDIGYVIGNIQIISLQENRYKAILKRYGK